MKKSFDRNTYIIHWYKLKAEGLCPVIAFKYKPLDKSTSLTQSIYCKRCSLQRPPGLWLLLFVRELDMSNNNY